MDDNESTAAHSQCKEANNEYNFKQSGYTSRFCQKHLARPEISELKNFTRTIRKSKKSQSRSQRSTRSARANNSSGKKLSS
jgi:hypothetical protein